MFVAGQAAQFAFRGEYKKGRGYRIGWTAQLAVSFSCLLALPILLVVRGGRAALPLWSSVVGRKPTQTTKQTKNKPEKTMQGIWGVKCLEPLGML
jgi:hypothetical protein